jgi:hypothetical protein
MKNPMTYALGQQVLRDQALGQRRSLSEGGLSKSAIAVKHFQLTASEDRGCNCFGEEQRWDALLGPSRRTT